MNCHAVGRNNSKYMHTYMYITYYSCEINPHYEIMTNMGTPMIYLQGLCDLALFF